MARIICSSAIINNIHSRTTPPLCPSLSGALFKPPSSSILPSLSTNAFSLDSFSLSPWLSPRKHFRPFSSRLLSPSLSHSPPSPHNPVQLFPPRSLVMKQLPYGFLLSFVPFYYIAKEEDFKQENFDQVDEGETSDDGDNDGNIVKRNKGKKKATTRQLFHRERSGREKLNRVLGRGRGVREQWREKSRREKSKEEFSGERAMERVKKAKRLLREKLEERLWRGMEEEGVKENHGERGTKRRGGAARARSFVESLWMLLMMALL